MNDFVTFTVTATEEQLKLLDKAWKKDRYALNRSDFVRAAINAYAGEQIFPEKKRPYQELLEEEKA